MMRRKRPKLVEQLLNTNWSKASQQISNLSKFNRLLLISDLNILDEKSGQSPLSLVVSSTQINTLNHNSSNCQTHNTTNSSNSCPSSSSSSSLLSLGGANQSSSIVSNNNNSIDDSSTSNHHIHHDHHHQKISSNHQHNQGASLLALQCQSSGLNMNQILTTSVSDLINSKGPLVERIIQLMVKAGGRLDMRNVDGKTPLHIAASKSNFWALKTLLDLGSESDCRDENGLTPLYYSILDRADLKVTQLLLSHQYQSFQQNSTSTSTTNNNYLITNNYDVTSTSNNTKQQQESINNSNSIGIKDQHGWQEVHHACKLGLDTHLEKLLYYGCDINAKIDGSGNTPLHVAAINDQISCAKVLLLRGADKTITNSSHQTAHQVAVIAGNMDLAEFISEYSSSQVIPFKDRPSDFIRGFGARLHQICHNNNNENCHHPSAQQQQQTSYANNNQNNLQQQQYLSRQLSTRSVLVSSQSSFHLGANTGPFHHQSSQRFADNQRLQQFQQKRQAQQQHNQKILSPLSLELMNTDTLDQFPTIDGNRSISNCNFRPTASTTTMTTTAGSNPTITSNSVTTMLPIPIELAELNNVSPCLSQRSFATSNTTSSSGVCMDGDGINSANEDSNLPSSAGGSLNRRGPMMNFLNQSISQHSNITVISIGGGQQQGGPSSLVTTNSSISSLNQDQDNCHDSNSLSEDASTSSSNDESCYNDLYSLMLDERPLVTGSTVEATSDYHSGDPSHLELHRGDLIEIMDCLPDLLHAGQLPRLANKPMLYGRIRDGDKTNNQGLFPSFCVRRTKSHNHRNQRRTQPVITNPTPSQPEQSIGEINSQEVESNCSAQPYARVVETQSLLTIDRSNNMLEKQQRSSTLFENNSDFTEFQVTLTKSSDGFGFGFVLRGAKIDPNTLATTKCTTLAKSNILDSHDVISTNHSMDENESTSNNLPTSVSTASVPGATASTGEAPTKNNRFTFTIDDELMKKNNLASLQYLDEIEPNSVADKAGLKRGDFLVAVNNHDVRLESHEQVVRMIRESGVQVHLTIATPQCFALKQQKQQDLISKSMIIIPPTYATTRTLGRIKPDPPKRDPTTTLSRNNKSQLLTTNHHAKNITTSVTSSSTSSPSSTTTTRQKQEDSHSLASTLSLHNTPTHSTSSGSTQTTVEANTVVSQEMRVAPLPSSGQCEFSKPNVPPKPTSKIENIINHQPSQPIYQPAIMTTTTRRRQSAAPTIASKSVVAPTTITNSSPNFNSNQVNKLSDKLRSNQSDDTDRFQSQSQPQLPPPPPPLPDFSQSPVSRVLSAKQNNIVNHDHRRSIQVDLRQGIASINLDAESLRGKRASLANVSSSSNNTNNVGNSWTSSGAPELGSVAAACAAAANDRMLRQQQLINKNQDHLDDLTSKDQENQKLRDFIKDSEQKGEQVDQRSEQLMVEQEQQHVIHMKPLPPTPPQAVPPQILHKTIRNDQHNHLSVDIQQHQQHITQTKPTTHVQHVHKIAQPPQMQTLPHNHPHLVNQSDAQQQQLLMQQHLYHQQKLQQQQQQQQQLLYHQQQQQQRLINSQQEQARLDHYHEQQYQQQQIESQQKRITVPTNKLLLQQVHCQIHQDQQQIQRIPTQDPSLARDYLHHQHHHHHHHHQHHQQQQQQQTAKRHSENRASLNLHHQYHNHNQHVTNQLQQNNHNHNRVNHQQEQWQHQIKNQTQHIINHEHHNNAKPHDHHHHQHQHRHHHHPQDVVWYGSAQ